LCPFSIDQVQPGTGHFRQQSQLPAFAPQLQHFQSILSSNMSIGFLLISIYYILLLSVYRLSCSALNLAINAFFLPYGVPLGIEE